MWIILWTIVVIYVILATVKMLWGDESFYHSNDYEEG